MLKPPLFGSPFRHVRRAVLTASILPAALATQAWAVDWSGPVTIDVDPVVAVGLVEGKADGSVFDITTPNPNVGNPSPTGPDRDGLGAGISLGIFMGQENANYAELTTDDSENFWNDLRTWIYTGEINSGPNGLLSFAESIDDATQIVIDGTVVLQDQVWDVPTTSGVLQFTPNTYHTIEIRVGNGFGGAGPVSLNNFMAAVPTVPPTGNGYGFGFSQTGATGTDGNNYVKPIDPGDGSLFRHETAPAAAANQDINVLGDTVVTLNKLTSDHITENSITFAPTTSPLTLTVNGSTPGGTLRSLSTVLSTTASKQIIVNGDADFAPGALYTGPTVMTDTLTGIVLRKNGGTGKLILDNPTNALTGTTLQVWDGTLSIVGGGGTMNPVSDLATPIEIGGTATGLAPVLRIGGGIVGTTFANRIYVKQDGTIEHISPGIDTISGSTFAIEGSTVATSATATFNIANGGLIVTAAIGDNLSATIGGHLRKLGNNTTLSISGGGSGGTNVRSINAAEGRLEVSGRLRGLTAATPITIGATATLALLNGSATAFNQLPATLTVTTGTLEGVPGAFTNSTGAPSTLNLNGGALTLGPDFAVSPGLVASLYPDGDTAANAAFNSYANYVNYFATRTQNATVTNTAANGYPSLEFGLPIGSNTQMFAPIAPTFTETDTLVSRMQGKINITVPGLYTIGAGSDDGSMVYIDGQTVVANNFYQGHTRRTGTVALTKGLHDIDIGFYEGGGANELVVDWAGPGVTGTETIPNSVLIPIPTQTLAYNNPVVVPESSTINVGAASVASVNMTAGKTLTVNGYRLVTGPLTLNGAGTYTFNTNTLHGETIVPSIIDGGAAVALVGSGQGTLILEAGASPQLQNAASTITATAGAIGLVLGPVNPTGNATVNVNGKSLILSSKGGDQTYALPSFTNGGSIAARRIGSGVAGTSATPIRVTLTGNLALDSGTTLNLGSAYNYIPVMSGGISGDATVNIDGTVETTGVVNVGGPLNVNSEAILRLGADDVLGNFAGGTSSVTVNGGTVTAVAGTHSTLPAVTLNGGALAATGPGNAPSGPTINYILNGNVTTVPNATPSTITAPAIQLRGAGTNGPVTFTVPRGTASTDLVVTSVIHDGGAGLIKNGDGIMTLSGVNTYTGPTVINAGRVEAENSSSLGGSAVTLNDGGILSVGARPTIFGFGDVTLNNGASVTDDILTLTTDVGGQSRSAFTNTRYSVGDGFSASFVYTATGAAGPNGLADGITFTLQNNAPTALGGGGGGLGYAGMLNSASLQLNIYLGAGQPIGTNVRENGATGTYISSAPVNLAGGNPIKVDVIYDPVALTFTETLTDLVTTATYMNTFNVPALSGILGGNLGYVGFTGATGGLQAYQTVERFVFNDFSQQQDVTVPNDITVSAGATAGLDVPLGGNGTLEGILTLDHASILKVTGGETATDIPYLLDVTGLTTLTGHSTIDVANNGTGEGTLQLDDVSGSTFSLTKTGAGTLALGGTLDFAVLNANEGITEINANLTPLTALNIGAAGVVVLGGSAPAPLAFDAETAGATEQAVPEPGSAILLLSGLSALLARRCHRRSLPPQW